jgi:hypothetical protein
MTQPAPARTQVTRNPSRRAPASPAVSPPAPGSHPASTPEPALAWWRFGMVWLVVGGPALVVVASLGTAVVAYRGADLVLVDTPSARVLPVQPTSKTPALTARNHAATAATAATAAAGR